MELYNAETLAISLMSQHGLIADGWRFEWDRGLRRFGCCHYGSKKITLSAHIARLNDEANIRDTILHEMAHALVGRGHHHNYVWKAKCREIGANPERCYDGNEVTAPVARYVAHCPDCGKVFFQHRLGKKSNNHFCKHCYSIYVDGRQYVKGKLTYVLNVNGIRRPEKLEEVEA